MIRWYTVEYVGILPYAVEYLAILPYSVVYGRIPTTNYQEPTTNYQHPSTKHQKETDGGVQGGNAHTCPMTHLSRG